MRLRGKRVALLLVPSLILSILFTGCSAEKKASSPVNTLKWFSAFESGTSYRTADDIYWVLNLSGSWEEMGRQYGRLVGDDLKEFYGEITQDIVSRGMSTDELLKTSEEFTDSLNDNMRELMKGMSETSGLSYEQIQQLNAGMITLPSLVFGQEPPGACSAIVVSKDYTTDGKLIFGRNWDMDGKSMRKYMKYLAVVVYHPNSGNSFADVHPLGSIYTETGFNEKGLFVEINNGSESDPHYYADRENSVVVLAKALNQCSTADEAANYIGGIPGDRSYIIQAADAGKCVSIERPTFGYRVRTGDQKGLLVAYNSFVPPYPQDWQSRVSQPPTVETDPRYQNLVNTASSGVYYGKFNVDVMKTLMSLDVAHGGAVHSGTVLQVITVPADLTLWLHGYGYSDWQQVDLNGLFR